MYECGKLLFYSMYEHKFSSKETTINKTKEIVDM